MNGVAGSPARNTNRAPKLITPASGGDQEGFTAFDAQFAFVDPVIVEAAATKPSPEGLGRNPKDPGAGPFSSSTNALPSRAIREGVTLADRYRSISVAIIGRPLFPSGARSMPVLKLLEQCSPLSVAKSHQRGPRLLSK
jgi:hypothetical protein